MPKWNRRGDGWRPQWLPVQDETGKIVGTAYFEESPFKQDLETVKQFLMKISKQKGELEMSKETNEQTNMVFLAGIIKKLSSREESAFLLLDVGENSKFVPCTIYLSEGLRYYEEKELLRRLDTFREGDFIKIQGFARAWSQKKNDEWKNSMDIRITRIANEAPKRETKKADAPSQRVIDNDSIPF